MPSSTQQLHEATRRRTPRRLQLGYLYVAPALVIIVGIVYFGAFYNAWISTLDWNGLDPDPEVVGVGNYVRLAADAIFWTALQNVAIFGVITILVQMCVGLVLALVLSGPVIGRNIYRALIFIPVVLAPAAISTAFRQFLRPDGQINDLLDTFGLGFLARAWIADPDVALYALAAVNIFSWTGFSFLLYQAALSQIDQSHLEAAQIDGASTVRTVRSIVIPQLRMTHITLALTGVIGSLKAFDIIFLITGGGPGRSTEFLTTYIYKEAITQFNVGYGAALSMVVLGIALLLTLVQIWIYRMNREV